MYIVSETARERKGGQREIMERERGNGDPEYKARDTHSLAHTYIYCGSAQSEVIIHLRGPNEVLMKALVPLWDAGDLVVAPFRSFHLSRSLLLDNANDVLLPIYRQVFTQYCGLS